MKNKQTVIKIGVKIERTLTLITKNRIEYLPNTKPYPISIYNVLLIRK